MLKKLFAISTLLLVLVIGALFVYNFLFKKQPPDSVEPDPKTAQEGKVSQPASPKKTEEKKPEDISLIKAVSSEPVFGATISSDGNSVYYFLKSNGQLNQVNPADGKLEKVLSTESFPGIKNVVWNKPKSKAIVKTEPEPGQVKFFYLDVVGGKSIPLKDNIDSVAWSNLGDKIIYKYYDPKTKKRTVSVSDPDGKNWHDLTEFNYRSVEIAAIPSSGDITFWPSADARIATTLEKISFAGENKAELVKEKFGADFLWSPDGRKAIASCADQKGGSKTNLYLMSPDGKEFQSLMFPTFASKCVWTQDSKTVFCALPGNIAESAVLPNDWQEGKLSTADTFWKIDTVSGKKERFADPEKIGGSFDVLRPSLSQDEKTLFFINKADGKLYKLAI